MPQFFEIHSYSVAKLKEILAAKSKASLELIERKLHCVYFEHYFAELQAKVIIVENEYIDRDFLDDYAGYYVRCFKDYGRVCVRLHFFDLPLEATRFEALLSKADNELVSSLQSHYLGFLVVKPLPQTVIGRTCLKTYPHDDRRYFQVTRNYDANLFGIALEVKTLAYQEQDQVAAACATSALWSAFHGTGKMFQHAIPTPLEITKTANTHLPDCTYSPRALPSSGLTASQMVRAIRNVSLDPVVINASNENVCYSTLYAYLKSGVPVLMGVYLVDVSVPSSPSLMGLHAIAATGYSLGKKGPVPYGPTNFTLTASRMDKIYAHDDQVGPFARMEIFSGPLTFTMGVGAGSPFQVSHFLGTSWRGKDEQIGSVKAGPFFIMMPLYNKIRIPFANVHNSVVALDFLIELMRASGILNLSGRLEWDIYLTTVNDLKTDLLDAENLVGSRASEVLTRSMPRFLWRASAIQSNEKQLDLFFDATDIEQASFLSYAIGYNDDLFQALRTLSKDAKVKFKPEWKILHWFSTV